MPTYARKTALDIGVLTLLTTDYSVNVKDLKVDYQDMQEDGRGLGERYQNENLVKSKMTFSGSILHTVTAVRQSMLNMTVFSVGGTAQLGRMRSGNMQVTSSIDLGEGGADPWEYPFVQSTEIRMAANMQVATIGTYAKLMATSGPANRLLTVIATMNGFSTTLPMNLAKAAHGLSVGKIQTEDIELSLYAAPSAATGIDLLVAALTGTASGAFSLDTGANLYTAVDGFVITSAQLQWASGQLTKFDIQGQSCGVTTAT